jgi:hypothetical protein
MPLDRSARRPEDRRLEFPDLRPRQSELRRPFSVSYAHLHRYVRRPGIESDMHLLTPGEFHADTTELVQMLRDGRHHGVIWTTKNGIG